MQTAPEPVFKSYMRLLEWVIIDLRKRIRYGDHIEQAEIHDILDAIHNIPEMVRNYGGWFVEENIDWALAHYDEKWMDKPTSVGRPSLIDTLELIKQGLFDH